MFWPFNLIWPWKKPSPKLLSATTTVQKNDLHTVLCDAIIKADWERQQSLRKLLDDEKLKEYFQHTIQKIAEKVAKDKGLSFIGHYECDVPENAWTIFMEIFSKTCNEMGLAMAYDSIHLRIDGKAVREFFEKISPTPVDVDERVRTMLSQGAPYR